MAEENYDEEDLTVEWNRGRADGLEQAAKVVLEEAQWYFVRNKDETANMLRAISRKITRLAEKQHEQVEAIAKGEKAI